MIEKVVNHIDKLDQPHLKLVVMHNFMWALIEELASNRVHAHQARNKDSGHDIRVVDSEVHDISQDVINWALRPSRPMVCEYMRDKALTVNVLWDIAYGLHHEALHLDSLEDFNATEADLMSMKDDILATWKSRDASGDHCSPSCDPKRRTWEQEDRPDAPKPSRSQSKSRHRQNVRERQSCSRKQALSQTLWGGSPHDSSSSQGQKLPTPPQPPCSETSKKAEAQQMAFRDAMEVTRSPPMTWEDQVQEEEEEHKRHSSTGGDSQPCPSSPPLEGCNISDISMAEEGPQQCDSDVIVEEEREESMETDAPLDSATPTLLKEEAIPEDPEAEVKEDRHSQTS